MLVEILACAKKIAIKQLKIKMADHPVSVHLGAGKRTRQSNGLNMKWHFAQLMNHYPYFEHAHIPIRAVDAGKYSRIKLILCVRSVLCESILSQI